MKKYPNNFFRLWSLVSWPITKIFVLLRVSYCIGTYLQRIFESVNKRVYPKKIHETKEAHSVPVS